jgi:hypothetical protein
MGKILKILAGVVLVGVLGGAIAAYSYWQKLTTVPAWSRSEAGAIAPNPGSANPDDPPSADQPVTLDPATIRTAATPLYQRLGQLTVDPQAPPLALTAADLETLVLDRILAEEAGAQLLQSVEGFGATLEGNTLKTGLVINTSNLPQQLLGSQETAALDRLVATVPGLQGRSLYVGLVGQPQVQGGAWQWNDTLQVQVGEMTWSLADFAQQTGLDPGKLEQQLNKGLEQLPIENLRIQEDRLVIEGATP